MFETIVAYIFVGMAGLSLLGSLLFVNLFRREPWRRTPFGRSLMAMAVAVGLFSLMAFMRLFFGPTPEARVSAYPGEDLLRLAVYSLVIYAVWSRYFVLRRERRK